MDVTPEKKIAPPGSVVIGLDGTKESRAALHWGIKYASATKRPVHAVSVWHRELFGDEGPIDEAAFEDEANRWVRVALSELAEDEKSADLHIHLDEGDPTAVLLEQSQEADALVLGNHRHRPLHEALVGSTTQRLSRKATCTIVLVSEAAAG